MMKEILYILLDNYAEHEIGFLPGAVSTDATGFRKEPKYINKMVAPMMEQYQKTGGVMNEEQLTKAIASVTQLPEKGAIVGGTLWTMVMDLKHPSVTYYSRRHFDKPLHFELSQTN